jgi:hypothetical protein
MDDFLKKSWPANPPNSSSKILPSTLMTTNRKCNIANSFNQFNHLPYRHNHPLQPPPQETQ